MFNCVPDTDLPSERIPMCRVLYTYFLAEGRGVQRKKMQSHILAFPYTLLVSLCTNYSGRPILVRSLAHTIFFPCTYTYARLSFHHSLNPPILSLAKQHSNTKQQSMYPSALYICKNSITLELKLSSTIN